MLHFTTFQRNSVFLFHFPRTYNLEPIILGFLKAWVMGIFISPASMFIVNKCYSLWTLIAKNYLYFQQRGVLPFLFLTYYLPGLSGKVPAGVKIIWDVEKPKYCLCSLLADQGNLLSDQMLGCRTSFGTGWHHTGNQMFAFTTRLATCQFYTRT